MCRAVFKSRARFLRVYLVEISMSSSRLAWKPAWSFWALALSMAASAAYAYPAWRQDTFNDGSGAACASAWTATNVYTGGSSASAGSVNYTANYWSQGVDPSIHNGSAGSGEPWTSNGSCSGGATNSPTNDPLSGNPAAVSASVAG
jgi:hypothetical protein